MTGESKISSATGVASISNLRDLTGDETFKNRTTVGAFFDSGDSLRAESSGRLSDLCEA